MEQFCSVLVNQFNFLRMNFCIIRGIIAGASAIKRFQKKNGKVNQSADLHLKEICNDPHPMEVAVKVTGEHVHYAGCVGMTVEVGYVVRVFPFKDRQTGESSYGNEVYAHTIKTINADRSAMLNQKEA